MILDIILVAIIFIWAVFGYRKGFIRQIFVFVGILAVAFGSVPLADIAEKIISEEFEIVLTGRYVKMFLLAGCAAIIFIITTLVGRFLQETLVQGIPMAEKTNHILGAVIGIISSFIVVVFILSVCAVGHTKIEHYAPGFGQFLSKSTSYQIVLKNNPVLVFDFFKEFESGIKERETSETQPRSGRRDDVIKTRTGQTNRDEKEQQEDSESSNERL